MITPEQELEAIKVAIHELLKGDAVSNEYLSVISAIQHSTGVS
jgi:hypothetical protein